MGGHMSGLLMPKSTATWLVENTSLTFDQIAKFCSLHVLEVKAIANGSIRRITPLDPISYGQLTKEEILRCEEDSTENLRISINETEIRFDKNTHSLQKSPRQKRPNGILWMLQHYSHLPDQILINLLKTTLNTIKSIRNKSYKNYQNLTPQNPVSLGICTQEHLDKALLKYTENTTPTI